MSVVPARRRAPVAVAIASLMLVVLAACKAEGRVVVDVARDGSGTVTASVTLDDAALRSIGDLSTQLHTADLEAAGWTVAGPTTAGDLTTVSASKPFGAPEALGSVLDEVAGPGTVFRDWKVELGDGFATRSWTVGGTLASSGSLEQFSDVGVADQLGGLALGRTPEELAAEGGGSPPTFPLVVEVHLPDGTTASADLVLGEGQPTSVPLSASASEADRSPIRWFVGAAILLLIAVTLVVWRRFRQSRHR